MSEPASSETVLRVLRKVLPEARLNRIPRNPEHQTIVLGLLSLGLRRRYPYKETELNEYLKARLAALHARVDHVTCRRYLVDLGFVRRDRAGARYILNYPKLESSLSEEAIASAAGLVEQALADGRKRANGRPRV